MEFKERVLIGLGAGVLGAIVLSAWVGVLTAVGGSEQLAQKVGISPPRLIAYYFVGGIGAGLIGGVLAPLARHTAGAALVGYVASLPFFSLVMVTLLSPTEWREAGVALTLIAALVGAGAGVVVRGKT